MKLRSFQERAVTFLTERRRAILGSEVGTGKSAVAIIAANRVTLRKPPALIYIVCPSSVKYSWEKEIKKWCYLPAIQVVKTASCKIQKFSWIIFSYEMFTKKHLELKTPDVLIVDEAHYCKNPKTKRTKAVLTSEPAISSGHVWLLTGTPFPNNLIDAWPLFRFCLKQAQIGSYWQFAHKYCYVLTTAWGKKIIGCNKINLSKLIEIVKPILHRDTVKDNLSELPEFEDIIVPLERNSSVRGYETELCPFEDSIVKAVESGVRVSSKEDEHISTLRKNLGLTKVPQAAQFILNLLEQGEKVVVFAHHTQVIMELQELLKKEKVRSQVIVGGTSPEEREKHIEAFQNGEDNCLILSILAAGVGITLTAARIAVFVEEYWTPASLEQARARIHRMGQKSVCLYYYLHYENSLDEKVHKILMNKMKDVNNFWEEFENNSNIC